MLLSGRISPVEQALIAGVVSQSFGHGDAILVDDHHLNRLHVALAFWVAVRPRQRCCRPALWLATALLVQRGHHPKKDLGSIVSVTQLGHKQSGAGLKSSSGGSKSWGAGVTAGALRSSAAPPSATLRSPTTAPQCPLNPRLHRRQSLGRRLVSAGRRRRRPTCGRSSRRRGPRPERGPGRSRLFPVGILEATIRADLSPT